jgi:UDP-N-acetylglucosamine 2-epimerase (non-hydrolysing)
MSVTHVVGARPNFPKAAPVIRALGADGVPQRVVHTGQHYGEEMTDIFFRELGLPAPDVNLGVGSGSHARQTAAVMVGLEDVLLASPTSLVVVYGDVNSTVAAALVAAKLRVPLAHVEAGLRSFDRTMPEELNRIVTDQLCDLLFATSADALRNLEIEGIGGDRVHLVGNSMIDTLLASLPRLDSDGLRRRLDLPAEYVVATVHRPGNVDAKDDAAELVAALHAVADQITVVLPLHPRGRPRLEEAGLTAHPALRVVQPLGYLDFLSLLRGARAAITDSGGVQEETTVLGLPCLTVRPNTERPVTVSCGTNRLVTRPALAGELAGILRAGPATQWPVPPLWDGQAGPRIATVLEKFLLSTCD